METQSWATLITEPLGAIQRLHSEGHAVVHGNVKEYFNQCIENMPLEKVRIVMCIVSVNLNTFEFGSRRQGCMGIGRANGLFKYS